MSLSKKWTMYIIHHSHTDIGYTERQDKIIRYQCDFIKQAVDILNDLHINNKIQYRGFKWQCENYWQVKNFYENSSEDYIKNFEKYIKSGEIGLSGNYLNLTELIAYDVLDHKLREAADYAKRLGINIKSGMSADINGFAWGYSKALHKNGITRLFSCLHPHHGMFPLYKKQIPFWWETPKGNKILVWNGDQYHLGNELLLSPNAGNTYMIKDEFEDEINTNQLEVLETRVSRYLKNLEGEEYPYDFVPVMVSGAITDNAPPNGKIAERISEMNKYFKGNIKFEMVTLDDFFDIVESKCVNIDTYKGDWNDWWADGVGSTSAVVKHFRDAQRKYDLCGKLDPKNELGDNKLLNEAEENLIMYAEHTWGYSSSVSEPFETLVNDLELKKSSYAINANTAIAKNLDKILASKGEVTISPDRVKLYKIINPYNNKVKDPAKIYLEFWEFIDDVRFKLGDQIEVIDEKSGKVLKSQVIRIARAYQVEVMMELEAKEERIIRIRNKKNKVTNTIKNHAYIGAEGVEDILSECLRKVNIRCLDNDFYKIILDEDRGIISIKDKIDDKELIRSDSQYTAFQGIYEITNIVTTPCEERRRMGRNRKSASTNRYSSRVKNISIVENGDIFATVALNYELEGTGEYTVFLKVYNDIPKIEAKIRVHKSSRWEPENLYVSLPFTTGQEEVKYIDKTGCIIRPGIDQLPGSNMEFYLLQNGIACIGENKSLVIAIKDAPLVTFGDLKAHQIELCSGENTKLNKSTAFSWVMNNYWETNFKVDLGGFYEFQYTIYTTHEKYESDDAINKCIELNEELISINI